MWVRELIAALFLLSFQGPFQNYQKREEYGKNMEKIEGMFWGEWLRAKNLKYIFDFIFRNVGMLEGRFWGEWLGDETTNEGNIRLQP